MDDIIEIEDITDYCKKCRCRFVRIDEDYNRFGKPLKTCSKCRIRKREITKTKSIDKVDYTDDEIADRRKFNTIKNLVEIDNFFDKLGNSIKYKCIDCELIYIRGDDDYDEVGEPYEKCSKCYPRAKKRLVKICSTHTFTTKRDVCDVCGTCVFIPDSESD